MAEQLYFSRDSKMFVVFNGTPWEVPVLDGFSFSQAVNSSEISLSEMENVDQVSRRGTRRFTDALAPAEFSFSTYIRPYLGSAGGLPNASGAIGVHAAEEVFWAQLGGADTYTQATGAFSRASAPHPDHPTGVVSVPSAVNNTGSTFNFDQSNRAVLSTMEMYFVMDTSQANPMVYRLNEAVVNEVTVDFDVDGIAMLNWSGFAKQVEEWRATDELVVDTTANILGDVSYNQGRIGLATDNDLAFYFDTGAAWAQAIDESVDDTDTFIRNRLTQLALTANDVATFPGQTVTVTAISQAAEAQVTTATSHGLQTGDTITISGVVDDGPAGDFEPLVNTSHTITVVDTTNFTLDGVNTSATTNVYASGGDGATGKYVVTLTGGNITFTNNVSYLIPEELGKVNIPIEHITGARSVSGNFTCYLTLDDAGTDATSGTSSDLFNDLTSTQGLGQVVNSFTSVFKIGGVIADTPRLEVAMNNTHIEVPVHQIDDVIALETTFQGLPSNISDMDEMESITYKSRP